MDVPLDIRIEAVLFWKGEPVSLIKLQTLFDVDKDVLHDALLTLETRITERGIVLIRNNDEVTIGTSPKVSDLIQRLTKEELVHDLGKAGLETLSIIIYRGPISRREIDHIRGVNSTSIIRNLSIRGLVRITYAEVNQRVPLYNASTELLAFIGVSGLEELPEYSSIRNELVISIEKKDPVEVLSIPQAHESDEIESESVGEKI